MRTHDSRKRNIDHLHNHTHFEFMHCGVNFPLFVAVDQVCNLACPT